MNSFDFRNNLTRKAFTPPFHGFENWGSKRLNNVTRGHITGEWNRWDFISSNLSSYSALNYLSYYARLFQLCHPSVLYLISLSESREASLARDCKLTISGLQICFNWSIFISKLIKNQEILQNYTDFQLLLKNWEIYHRSIFPYSNNQQEVSKYRWLTWAILWFSAVPTKL